MAGRRAGEENNGVGSAAVTQVKPKTQKPSLYRVLLLNDDYTPMEFVVYVLERFFNKSREEATKIMLQVPSFSRNLEETLHRAVAYANQRRHEYATLEHLLLSLTDDQEAAGVMRACDVELPVLKKNLIN